MHNLFFRILGFLGLFSVGCTQGRETIESEFVFVPGSDFRQWLEVNVGVAKVPVGEEVKLIARRTNTGFIKINSSDYKGGCYFVSEPPSEEADASLNVTWFVDPKSKNYAFSVSESGNRTVKFTQPGIYKLKAHSALWCPPGIDSNEVEIVVE